MAKPSTVFISYAQGDPGIDKRALAIADRLETLGVEVVFDQYEPPPPEGWDMWTREGLSRSDYVLCLFTESYFNETNRWLIDKIKSLPKGWSKAIGVVFEDSPLTGLSPFFSAIQRFSLGGPDLSDPGFQDLYRVLTDQPKVKRPERGSVVRLVEEAGNDASPAVELPPLVVPPELVASFHDEGCVAFVGSGIAARAGLPTWAQLVESLLKQAVIEGVMTLSQFSVQMGALLRGDVNAVADNVISAFGDRGQVLDHYRQASVSDQPLPHTYDLLRALPFSAILTSNYDDLLGRALDGTDYELGLTTNDTERLLELLSQRNAPFLLRLYGDLTQPERAVLAPAEYRDLVRSNTSRFSRHSPGHAAESDRRYSCRSTVT